MSNERAKGRRAVRGAAIAVAALLLVPATTRAQQGAIIGTVTAEAGGRPVGGVTVRLPKLDRAAQTTWTGDYGIDGLPAGSYLVVAEARGFAAESIQVEIPASGATTRDFKLKAVAASVAAAGSVAMAAETSTRLADFELRRSQNKGVYLTRDQLEHGGRLMDMMRPIIRGARFQSMADGSTRLISTRVVSTNFMSAGEQHPCFVQVWLDGQTVGTHDATTESNAASTPSSDAGSDFSSLNAAAYDGVEYYADLSTTPPQYRMNDARCGTLLLWSHAG